MPKLRRRKLRFARKNRGWRLVDFYQDRDTASAVAGKYAPSRVIRRREKWEVWTRQNPKNLFGFGKAKPGGRPSRKLRKTSTTFEGSSTIKEIAFDQGYNDAKKDYRRNLSPDEILEYISGQRRAKEWVQKVGKSRIAQIYRHDYIQGRKKWKIEQKKAQQTATIETKKELEEKKASVTHDLVDALAGQGMKRSEASAKVKRFYKAGDSFDDVWRKVMAKSSSNPPDFRLYHQAKAADDRFQRALVKAYGKLAGDMRYQTSQQTPEIRWLGQAKQQADEAWLKSMRSNPKKRAPWMPAPPPPNATQLEKRLDALLNRTRDRARMDEMQREMLKDKHSPKYLRMSKQYMKDVREIEKLQKQYRELHGIPNPAKFDRCVADVKKSLAKYKRPGNAYAICTKAGTRNKPKPSARARTKTAHRHRKVRKAPKTKQSRNLKVWSARQGKLSAEITKPLVGEYKIRISHGTSPVEEHKARKFDQAVGIARLRLADTRLQSVNPALSEDEQGLLNHVMMWGSSGYPIHKVKSGWVWGPFRSIKGSPKVYKTKAEATKAFEAYEQMLIDRKAGRINPKRDDLPSRLIPGLDYLSALGEAGHRVGKGLHRTTKGVLKKFKARVRGKKNPIGEAQKTYEQFHGMPSKEVLEIVGEEHHHDAVAAVGQLVSLLVILPNGKTVPLNAPGFSEHISGGKKYWEFDERTPVIKRVLVTTSEDGKQLFLDGGDQSFKPDELKAIGFTDRDQHDHMLLGTIKMLTYRTAKKFERNGKEAVDFYHTFGAEGSKGVAPILLYYPRSKKMRIAGGRYYIAPPRSDIGASPGLVG